MHVNDLLTIAVENGASDLHIRVGSTPMMRVAGTLTSTTDTRLTHDDVKVMAAAIMSKEHQVKFQGD